MSRGIFITATGTDVGKTYISGQMLKKIRSLGTNAGYYKAALSGAEINEAGGELIAGDAHYVYKTSEIEGNPNEAVTYILKEPASPHLSAKLENVNISMKDISKHYENHCKKYDFILAEGSGGIICPISLGNERIMLEDIIKFLGFDIIIVADAGLGTINSTMLTVEYAKMLNIGIRGIILNNYDEENLIHRDNFKVIGEFTKIPVYVCKKNGKLEIFDEDLRGLIED
ncbi:MAG: dethiobiotin synthase [Clostridium sp.]